MSVLGAVGPAMASPIGKGCASLPKISPGALMSKGLLAADRAGWGPKEGHDGHTHPDPMGATGPSDSIGGRTSAGGGLQDPD